MWKERASLEIRLPRKEMTGADFLEKPVRVRRLQHGGKDFDGADQGWKWPVSPGKIGAGVQRRTGKDHFKMGKAGALTKWTLCVLI